MNDAERQRLIGDTARLLAGLASISTGIAAGRDARRRAVLARPTLQASGGGGSGGGGGEGGHSDPTLSAIVTPADKARKVEQDLADDDADLVKAADLIHAVATRNARALRPAKVTTPPPVQQPQRCCKSCARAGLKVDIAVDRYSEYCRFCGDYRKAEERVPPVEACRWKERHGKNPRADQIARWLVEEKIPSRSGAR